MRNIYLVVVIFCILVGCSKVSIREEVLVMDTYPYSDPNPVINPSDKVYPYFKFDGYAHKSTPQEWKGVLLENEHVKVTILPEIGGKIWGAVEKSTGEDFVYYNNVVKFRNIAMRGPWTSGGIETNFGVIGHMPTTSSPVDYTTRTNKDGSISCFIGALEMLTSTWWSVEIKLEKDKSYFTTHTTWHNASPLAQPYYHWMNGGFAVSDDMTLCFPGNYCIGHGGNVKSWPVNEKEKNINRYVENDFGGGISNHVMGNISEYFGAYWGETDFGTVHHSDFDEKLGMKVFIWGLSRAGMLWEDLLTDTDGQYLELQSGRMFNQAASNSNKTPYKHISFEPYATDRWTEYWYPVKNIGPFCQAGKQGALSLKKDGNDVKLLFSPTQTINEKLVVYQAGEKIYETTLTSSTLKMWKGEFTAKNSSPLKVVLGDNLLVYDENPKNVNIERPQSSPEDFDWNTVYGKYLDGKLWMDQRNYTEAKSYLEKCLADDPNYSPALNLMAVLYYRMGKYETALEYARKSVSINTYDTEGNLIYGLINYRLGKIVDAKDGFSVLSYSSTHRLTAYIELVKCYVKENNLTDAVRYVEKAKNESPNSQNVLMLELLVVRKQGDVNKMEEILSVMEEKYPLNHYAKTEQYLLTGSDTDKNQLEGNICNEFPYQTYLELAGWYENMGCYADAVKILKVSPKNAIVQYRLAYLNEEQGNKDKAQHILKEAEKMDPAFMSPYRLETLVALEWANSISSSWQTQYYLGLLTWGIGDNESAQKYFEACGDKSDFAPFYMTRALLESGKAKEKELLKSEKLDESWRVGYALVNHYNTEGDYQKSLANSEKYTKKYPENYMLGLKYGTALLRNGKYEECITLLQNVQVLPNEGAYEGRMIYREANLLSAIKSLKLKKFDDAFKAIKESENYIENLGVGKPYNEDIDNRATNYITACVYDKMNKMSEAVKFYNKVIEAKQPMNSDVLFTALALKEVGKASEGQKMINKYVKEGSDKSATKYCSYIYNGNKSKADQLLRNTGEGENIAVWQASVKDRNILLVKAIIDQLY